MVTAISGSFPGDTGQFDMLMQRALVNSKVDPTSLVIDKNSNVAAVAQMWGAMHGLPSNLVNGIELLDSGRSLVIAGEMCSDLWSILGDATSIGLPVYWESELAPGTRPRKRKLLAMLLVDMVSYTTLSATNEEVALRYRDKLEELTESLVPCFSGRVVKNVGDAMLCVFDSADATLRVGTQVLQEFEDSPVSIRCAAHVGEVVEYTDGDVHGAGVNMTARIESETRPSEFLVSEDFYRIMSQQAEFSFKAERDFFPKGLDTPMKVYSVS